VVKRSVVVLAALWATGSVAATSVGLVAVRLVGNEVGEQVAAPLTNDAVREALTSVPSHEEHEEHEAGEEPSTSPSAVGPVQTFSTRGGIVSGRCNDDEPVLLYATPADGYRTVRSGPALVRFVGSTRQVTVSLSCHDDRLRAATTEDRVGGQPVTPGPTATPRPQPQPSEDESESPEPSHSETPEPSHSETPEDRTG
jgi:hypothetical protein